MMQNPTAGAKPNPHARPLCSRIRRRSGLRRGLSWRVGLVSLFVSAACLVPRSGHATPPAPTPASRSAEAPPLDPVSVALLVYDLLKLVAFFEQRGWTIDRYEIERILPEALLSVCRCSEAVRAGAAASLQRQITAEGGASEPIWRANGHDVGAVEDIITLERAAKLLATARARAAQECAYWMVAKDHFRGHQIDTGHVTLNFEGGGLFSVRRTHGRVRFGGGGSGRITAALPITTRTKLRLGPEIGGAALVDQDVTADTVSVDVVTSFPIAMRRFEGLYLYDVEVAPLMLGLWWRDVVRYGVRLGGLFGVSAPRLRSFLPWTGIAVGVEWIPRQGNVPEQWTLRMGLRFGIAWRVSD